MLSLEDKAIYAVLQIHYEDITKQNGMEARTERLNRLFKKDSTITKNQALDAFQTFRRPASMSIQAFSNEFDKGLHKTKSYGTVQSDYILVYSLLKSANSSNNHKELIKATSPDLKYNLIKDQLKKIFSDTSRHVPTKNEEVSKTEYVFLTEDFSEMAIEEGFNTDQEYNPFKSTNSQQTFDQELDTYYNKGN